MEGTSVGERKPRSRACVSWRPASLSATSPPSKARARCSTGSLPRDSLHLHLGLLVFFGWVAVRRTSLGAVAALLAAVAVAVGIEVFDLVDDCATFGAPRWGESAHDLVNTVFWPTAVVLLARGGRLEGGAGRLNGGVRRGR